jgi:DNA-binding NarL/FixJ family response regulator
MIECGDNPKQGYSWIAVENRGIAREAAMPITVLLTDDEEAVRSSIRRLLSSDPEIHIVGEVGSFQQTIQSALDLKPQVVVMDLHMPDDLSVGPQEIKSLLNTLGSRLIAMSFWNDQDTQALAQSLGAVILLDKMVLVTELIPAIKAAAIKQRTASVTTLDKEGQRADT